MFVDVETLKIVVAAIASFVAGIGWDGVWKTIDFSIREWVEKHGALGLIAEILVDLMHHTKSAVVLFAIGFVFYYPTLFGIVLMAFALGMIFVDAPKEKKRIIELLVLIMQRKPKKEIIEAAEGIVPAPEDEEKAKEMIENLLEETESSEEGGTDAATDNGAN